MCIVWTRGYLLGMRAPRLLCRQTAALTTRLAGYRRSRLSGTAQTAGPSPPTSPSPSLTPSETLCALRPFYLAVHPDLFTRFPREQAINEESLKELNFYLDSLARQRHRRPPKPVRLEFYVYPGITGVRHKVRPQAVDIHLQSLSIGSVVHDVLRSCDLSDRVSDTVRAKLTQIKTMELSGLSVDVEGEGDDQTSSYPDWEFAFSQSSSECDHRPVFLDQWLQQNLPLARKRFIASQQLREENDKALSCLCAKFDLQGVEFESEWTAVTVRSYLQAISRLLEREESVMAGQNDGCGSVGLSGATLVLGNRSEVDNCGCVHLGCEDTLQQWSEFLPLARRSRLQVETISAAESELSALWGVPMATFERPEATLLQDYLGWLGEYVSESRQLQGQHLGAVCGPLQLALSRLYSALAVASTGTVQVPASYPVDRVMDFLQRHQLRATQLRRQYLRQKQVTAAEIERCRKSLGLLHLTRSPALDDRQVVLCCQKLVEFSQGSNIMDLLAQQWLSLDNCYTVTADGKVVIPTDFILSSCE